MHKVFRRLATSHLAFAGKHDIRALAQQAHHFRENFDAAKTQAAGNGEIAWYPYDSLSNFALVKEVIPVEYRSLDKLTGGQPILDIGCADGATSFFLASLGHEVDAIDYGPTNFNGMRGVTALHNVFQTSVSVHSVDLDSQFVLPRETYGLALFWGILYHLKNPYYVLERLAKATRYCFLSTRITKFDQDKSVSLENIPVAYLVAPDETNGDETNFWIFSRQGLERILDRTGWRILASKSFGNTIASDPASAAGDERAFCLLESRVRQP